MVERYRQDAFRAYEGPWLASHHLQAMKDLANLKGWLRPDVAVQVPVTFSFVGSPHFDDPKAAAPTVLAVEKPEPR
jgi:hypothetical protein